MYQTWRQRNDDEWAEKVERTRQWYTQRRKPISNNRKLTPIHRYSLLQAVEQSLIVGCIGGADCDIYVAVDLEVSGWVALVGHLRPYSYFSATPEGILKAIELKLVEPPIVRTFNISGVLTILQFDQEGMHPIAHETADEPSPAKLDTINSILEAAGLERVQPGQTLPTYIDHPTWVGRYNVDTGVWEPKSPDVSP